MILLVALFVIIAAAFFLAGFTAVAFAKRKLLVWLAVSVAIFGSVLISFLVVLGLSHFGLVIYTVPPTDFGSRAFASWVATSWAAVLGIPLSAMIAVAQVFAIRKEVK